MLINFLSSFNREWFLRVSRDFFNPMFGLFEYTGAHYSLQINPASDVANVAHLEYFHFIGRVIGMVSNSAKFQKLPECYACMCLGL